MCTYPVQPICTFSCTSVFFINIYYPQYTVLHILSHCTSHTFYFIICSLFHSHLYLYIYILLCFIVLLLMLFLFSILLLLFYFFCTFHWADLSRPTFHYWLYPVWLCMWQIIKNLEPVKTNSVYIRNNNSHCGPCHTSYPSWQNTPELNVWLLILFRFILILMYQIVWQQNFSRGYLYTEHKLIYWTRGVIASWTGNMQWYHVNHCLMSMHYI